MPPNAAVTVAAFAATAQPHPHWRRLATHRPLQLMIMESTTALPDFSRGVDGLLPAIAQDHVTGRVLMMAWMNEQAWQETLRSGQACYYSRSRNALWRKGETSGHRQRVRKAQIDCDADCILLQVEQIGAACHEGYASCFFRSVQPDLSIRIEEPRLVDPRQVYGADRK